MGYAELRNAVVIQAVNDYAKMLETCKRLKINSAEEYFQKNYRRKNGYDSIANIIFNGLDAKLFLLDPGRLSLYTEIDGAILIRAAQVKANERINAKSTSNMMNKKQEET